MTDSNGNEVNAYDYDPFGAILNTGTNSVANPFQYEGGYFESSTGLVKFGTRYYNPNLGRWTQQDPKFGGLSNPDNLNRYLYVDDDPVNFVDQSGELNVSAFCIAGVITALIALVLTVFFTAISGGADIALALFIVETIPDFTLVTTAFIGCISGIAGELFLEAVGAISPT